MLASEKYHYKIDKQIMSLIYHLTYIFCRFVSPLFAGYIYSVSLSDANQSLGFPVDYHLIFIIFGLILLVVLIMTSYLPLSINNQKIISEDEASKIRV